MDSELVECTEPAICFLSQNPNELVLSLLSSSNTLESELELLPYVFELLILETNRVRLELYLSHVKEFLKVRGKSPLHVLNKINNMFSIAIGCRTDEGKRFLSIEERLWNGSLRFVSQYRHVGIRITVVEILDLYVPICIRCNQHDEMRKMGMLLLEMVRDANRKVALNAAKVLTSVFQHCSEQHVEFPFSYIPYQCVVALLTFHGGRAGTRFGSFADRKIVYDIFRTMNFSNLATFSLVVTSLQKSCRRKMVSVSSSNYSTPHSELESIEHCIQSVIKRHKHFNIIRELSIHSREQ